MAYVIRYRKSGSLLWKKIKVAGHSLNSELDRMDLFSPDGSILSLARWSTYDLKLGVDWVISTKQKMEEESGTDIKLKIGNA